MQLEMVGLDVWLRHTDKDGRSHVMQHRCWDRERFVQSQRDAARKQGGLADVQQITPEQYKKERTK
jgi:hypothetical protein